MIVFSELDLRQRMRLRFLYAEYLISCADTISLCTQDEVHAIHRQAQDGRFDGDIIYPTTISNLLKTKKGVDISCQL